MLHFCASDFIHRSHFHNKTLGRTFQLTKKQNAPFSNLYGRVNKANNHVSEGVTKQHLQTAPLLIHQRMTNQRPRKDERAVVCAGDLLSRWTGWHFGYASPSKPVPNKSESNYRELPSLCSFSPDGHHSTYPQWRSPVKSPQIYLLSDFALCVT